MKAKDIGLGTEKPKAECASETCPWHGHLKVRGRTFKGTVSSTKPRNTATIQWDYYNYVNKYERYERKKTKIQAHNPSCIDAKVDDVVRIAECRPISKTKKFVIIEKVL